MTPEFVFRILMIVAFIAMFGIRIYFQSKVLREEREVKISENKLSLAAGSIAALTTLIFGAEYIFFPGTFRFTYFVGLSGLAALAGCGFISSRDHIAGLGPLSPGKEF